MCEEQRASCNWEKSSLDFAEQLYACANGDVVRVRVELVPIAFEPSQATEPCTTTVRMRYESFVDAVGTVLAHKVMVWMAADQQMQALRAFPFTLTACAPRPCNVYMFALHK